MKTNRSRTLLGRGVLLTACSLLAKAIGAAYRLPLTNLLGAEGIGGYQLVFPVYALVLALTSSAMPVLLARQIAKDAQFGYAVFRRSLTLLAIQGVLGAVLLAVLSYPLAWAQGHAAMAMGYCVIAPAVVAVAVGAAFRGWFTANLHAGVLSGAALVEQVGKLSGLALAFWLRDRGLTAMVLGALAGVTVGELAVMVWCAVAYHALGYRLGAPTVVVGLKPVWQASVPITAANMIMPVVAGIDSFLLVNLSVWQGASRTEAVRQYGLLTGAVGTITAMPVVLTLAVATLVVPTVSRAVHQRRVQGVRRSSQTAMWVVVAISLPCAVLLAILAPDLLQFLYPRLTADQWQYASRLLAVGALGVPIVAMQQLYNALLQAVERSVSGAKQMGVAGAVKLAVDLALVPVVGMVGAAVATVACYTTALGQHAYTYRNVTGRYAFDKPMAACAFSALCMAGLVWALRRIVQDNTLCVVVNVLLGAAVYAIILWCSYGAKRWQQSRAQP